MKRLKQAVDNRTIFAWQGAIHEAPGVNSRRDYFNFDSSQVDMSTRESNLANNSSALK